MTGSFVINSVVVKMMIAAEGLRTTFSVSKSLEQFGTTLITKMFNDTAPMQENPKTDIYCEVAITAVRVYHRSQHRNLSVLVSMRDNECQFYF